MVILLNSHSCRELTMDYDKLIHRKIICDSTDRRVNWSIWRTGKRRTRRLWERSARAASPSNPAVRTAPAATATTGATAGTVITTSTGADQRYVHRVREGGARCAEWGIREAECTGQGRWGWVTGWGGWDSVYLLERDQTLMWELNCSSIEIVWA